MTGILVIVDGMTDRDFASTYGADMPRLASMRLAEWAETTPPGREPESLTCIMNILGVRDIPRDVRACADALGCGIAVGDDDLVLRLSWFAEDESGALAGLTEAPESAELDRCAEYRRIGAYKSLLIFRGMADRISAVRTRPPYAELARADDAAPSGMAELEDAFRALRSHGRVAVPWGQARLPRVEPLGGGAAAVCGAEVIKGMALLLGMETVQPEGATGDTDTDIAAKTREAIARSRSHGFVLLHLNGADEASHRRDAAEKRAFLRRVDLEAIAPLLDSGVRFRVMSDHSSEPSTGAHGAGPQPVFTIR